MIASYSSSLINQVDRAFRDYRRRFGAAGGVLRPDHADAVYQLLRSEFRTGNWYSTAEYLIPLGDTLQQAAVKLKAFPGSVSSCIVEGFTTADYSPSGGLVGATTGKRFRTRTTPAQVFKRGSMHLSLAMNRGYQTATTFHGIWGSYRSTSLYRYHNSVSSSLSSININLGGWNATPQIFGSGFVSTSPILTFNLNGTNGTVHRGPVFSSSTNISVVDPDLATDEILLLDVNNAGSNFASGNLDILFCAYGTTLPNPAERQIAIRDFKKATGRQLSKYFVIVGDSIAAASSSDLAWAARAMPTLGNGYDFINFAVSGDQVGNGTSTNHLRSSTRLSQLAPSYRPDWNCTTLVMHCGTNDLAASVSGSTLYNYITSYISDRQAEGWRMIVGTIFPRSNAGIPADFNTQRAVTNSSLVTNATSLGITLMDYGNDVNMGQDGDSDDVTYYNADKIHPNGTGASVMAGYFATALPTVL